MSDAVLVHALDLGSRRWLGISYPWDLLEANEWAVESERPVSKGTVERGVHIRGLAVLEEGAVVKSGSYLEGPVDVGKRCQIGPNAYLRPCASLGDDVK